MYLFRLLARPAADLRLPAFALFLALPLAGLHAQQPPAEAAAPESKPIPAERKPQPPMQYESFHLVHAMGQQDAVDIQTALRNMIPNARIFYLPHQNLLSVRATAEDMEMARRVLGDLDQPHPVYRLTFTLTEIEDGKRQAPEHYSMLLTDGNHSWLKLGQRVPIETGSYGPDDTKVKSLVQYQDIGLNIDTWLEGIQLRTKVEMTSLSPDKSGIGPQDPMLRQSIFDSYYKLTPGKPFLLGSVELPGGHLRQEVEMVAEAVP
ncbi:MAG: secretin N-terminal domain-containing protein [Terracidiphilus sp.]